MSRELECETKSERCFVNLTRREWRILTGRMFEKGFTNLATYLRTVIIKAERLNEFRTRSNKS